MILNNNFLTQNLFIMSTLVSTWVDVPINLDDSINDPLWADAGVLSIAKGKMMVKNNSEFLYVALDVTADQGNDPGTGDYFWFTFDRNRNAAITPNYDVNYGLYPGNPDKMGRQYYLGPGRWTGLINETSPSKCRIEFGPSPNSETPHRIWKMQFLLSDLNVSLGYWFPYTRFGFRIASSNPAFHHNEPGDFYTNFAALHYLFLSKKRVFPSGSMGTVFGGVGLIPFDKIVSGRATTASGYHPYVQNAAFGGKLNIIGNRTTLASLAGKKYRVLHREGTSGAFSPLLSSWKNYKWDNATHQYILQHFGPDTDDKYVIPSPAVDYSIDDLLIQFSTIGMGTGLHQFRIDVDAYSADTEILTLYIDNNLPELNINSITHNGAQQQACSIVKLTSDTDGLKFNITAHDPEGNLRLFRLTAHYGSNQSTLIDSQNYPGSGNWAGVLNLQIPASGVWVPPVTCAYQFRLTGWARTTNGYGYIGSAEYSEHLTILKPGYDKIRFKVPVTDFILGMTDGKL